MVLDYNVAYSSKVKSIASECTFLYDKIVKKIFRAGSYILKR